MAEVDSLEIRISASSTEAATAIGNLANKLNELKTAIRGGAGGAQFRNLAKNLEDLGAAAKNVRDSIGALSKAAKAIERLSSVGNVKIPKSLADGIRNVALAAEMVKPEAIANLDSMTRSLKRLANVDLKGVSSALRAVSTAGGKGVSELPKAHHFKINVDTGAIAKVGELAKSAWGHLKALGQRVRIRLESATIDKVRAKLDAVKGILRSFGRIAFYRAIRAAIKAITEAFKVGLEWAKKYSDTLTDAVDRRISTAMESLNVSANKMKLQLGAAFGSLITALAPVINTLIGLITSLATALTQLFAAFTGGTFLKAKDVSGDLAKNMKAGGGAAKEWKNQLMGFDEINRLEDQNGGGGGGGGGALNASDMFEVVEVDQAIQDFVDSVKEAFENGEWEKLGKLLGGKVNEIIDGINWVGIGQKLGRYLNGAIQSMYYAFKEIDFINLGKNIATMINRAIEKIDFVIWGRLLIRKMTAAFDLLIGFILGLNWTRLGDAIGDLIQGAFNELSDWLDSYEWDTLAQQISDNLIKFVNALNGARLGIAISTFVKKAMKNAKTFVENIKWAEIGEAIATQLNNFFTNLGSNGTGAADLASAISTFISGALTSLTTLVSTLEWETVANGMSDALVSFVENLDVLSLVGSLYDFLASSVSALIDLITTIKWGKLADAILTQVMTALGELAGKAFKALARLFEIPEDETDIKAIALAIVGKLWDGIKAAIDAGVTFVQDYIITPIKDAFDSWKSGDTTLGEIGKNIWEGVKNGIINALVGIGTWLKEHVWDPFIKGFKSVFGIESPSTEMEPYGGFIWEGVLNGIISALASIKTWVETNIWEPFKSGIESIFSLENAKARMLVFGQNIITGLKNGIVNGLSGIGSWIVENIWGPIQSGLNDIMLAIQQWWQSVTNFFGGITIGGGGSSGGASHHGGKFASGGFPQEGQLFLAREAGPELVGTMGGHTAVANNDQIVEGISQGVYGAVLAAMSNSGGGSNQPITIYLDGREIARSTTKYQNQMARAGAY